MTKKKVDNKQQMLKVTQSGSPIGRDESQRRTLIGLGLNKIGRSKMLVETPDILGMVTKVKHLIRVEYS